MNCVNGYVCFQLLHFLNFCTLICLKLLPDYTAVLTQTGKEFRDVDSISVFVSRLWERGVFQERNVIIMQYLMRSLKRMDLEKVCVNYAIKDQRALCYYENPLNQGTSILHVVNISNVPTKCLYYIVLNFNHFLP